MKRFEVEVQKNVFWIVSFERSKVKHVFLYEGEIHVSPFRTVDLIDFRYCSPSNLQELKQGGMTLDQ